MDDKLTDNIIKRDLLKRNNFISIVVICSVFLSIALINLFVRVIVSVIYSEAGIALLTTGGVCVVLILFAFLFAIFMNIKKAYKERNNILNNKYKVVNDTCLNIEKMKLTMTDLLLNTLGILRIQKVKFQDTSITSTLRSINPKNLF